MEGCTYTFTDHVDDDGMGTGADRDPGGAHVKGDTLALDFSGTDPQVKGSINCPLHSTRAGAYTAIRCVLSADLPTNGGFFRPITVTAPPGTLVSPIEPAATCNRALVLARVADTVFGALAQAAPDRTPACSEGMVSPMTWGVRYPDGRAAVWVDNHMSGRGGTPRWMRRKAPPPGSQRPNDTSVEVTEASSRSASPASGSFPTRAVRQVSRAALAPTASSRFSRRGVAHVPLRAGASARHGG